jgi:hypothetical protein
MINLHVQDQDNEPNHAQRSRYGLTVAKIT